MNQNENQGNAQIEAGLQSVAAAILGQAGTFRVSGFYYNFYIQPNTAGTSGYSYSFTGISLPRAVANGEQCFVFPTGAKWAIPRVDAVGSTTFNFSQDCPVSTTGMSSTWSALYFKPI